MDIRPQDLPELRADILAYYRQPAAQEYWRRMADASMFIWPGSGESFLAQEIRRLMREMYWVSPDMVHLACAASATMPDFRIDEPDLPSLYGFMVFGGSIGFTPTHGGERIPVTACSWGPVRGADGSALWLSLYTDTPEMIRRQVGLGQASLADAAKMHAHLPALIYENETLIPFGEGWDKFVRSGSALDGVGRVIRAAWSLMQQPLARAIDLEPDRAARKRLRRVGQEPRPVRVIELRRPPSAGSGDSAGNYHHHQWVVRGHWRQHWYPKRQVHRPVWIAPHIKGPEGAPLIGGEKVYAWRR